jgi:hypothetical protein
MQKWKLRPKSAANRKQKRYFLQQCGRDLTAAGTEKDF